MFFGLITLCLFATCPTKILLFFTYATTEAVVLKPSLLEITVGWEASIVATTEFVVPKSIPTDLPIRVRFYFKNYNYTQSLILNFPILLKDCPTKYYS